jgi:uncharacterized protein (UPF0333 family)
MTKPLRKMTIFSRERAQTFVEFALVFPLVLLITYGMIEFGRMMFIYAAVTNAAREGARYGAASGNVSANTPYYDDCDGIKSAVQRGALLTAIDNTNIIISYDNGHNPTQTWAACPPVSSDGFDPIRLGYRIIVKVSADYQPVLGSFLSINGFTINAQNARTILSNIEIK